MMYCAYKLSEQSVSRLVGNEQTVGKSPQSGEKPVKINFFYNPIFLLKNGSVEMKSSLHVRSKIRRDSLSGSWEGSIIPSWEML